MRLLTTRLEWTACGRSSWGGWEQPPNRLPWEIPPGIPCPQNPTPGEHRAHRGWPLQEWAGYATTTEKRKKTQCAPIPSVLGSPGSGRTTESESENTTPGDGDPDLHYVFLSCPCLNFAIGMDCECPSTEGIAQLPNELPWEIPTWRPCSQKFTPGESRADLDCKLYTVHFEYWIHTNQLLLKL